MTMSVPGRVSVYGAAGRVFSAGRVAAALKGPKSRKKASKKKKKK